MLNNINYICDFCDYYFFYIIKRFGVLKYAYLRKCVYMCELASFFLSFLLNFLIKYSLVRALYYYYFRDLFRFLIFYDDCVFCFVLNINLYNFSICSKSLIAFLTFLKYFINFYEVL